MGGAIRQPALLVRLVVDPCEQARAEGARPTAGRRVAVGEHGERGVRQLGGRPRRRVARRLSGQQARVPHARVYPSGDGCPSRCRRNARLAEAAVGIDAGVHQVDNLSDQLGGASAREHVDVATVELAEGVPATVGILPDRAKLSASDEPRFVLEPGAVAPGSVSRTRAFEHGALETQSHDRLVRHRRRRLGLNQPDPVADRKRLAEQRVALLPRPRSKVFACYAEDVEGDEPQPVRRGGPAGEYRAGDRGEVLGRLTVALANGDDSPSNVVPRATSVTGASSDPRRVVRSVPWRDQARVRPSRSISTRSRKPS